MTTEITDIDDFSLETPKKLVRPPLDEQLQCFLACPTPESWLHQSRDHLNLLIIDHANCEKKAAATALKLLNRYIDRPELLGKLSQLAREELLHFEQVTQLMQSRNISYERVSASQYAQQLHQNVRRSEPGHLIDQLIIGAFIEARSCERFHSLVPYVDDTLGRYYVYLLRSESRHFLDYLNLAQQYSQEAKETELEFKERVNVFRELEGKLITEPSETFRFHSGPIAY